MARKASTSGRADQYTGIDVAIGAGAGATIGVLIGGWAIATGISLGADVGVVIGAALDAQQRDRPV